VAPLLNISYHAMPPFFQTPTTVSNVKTETSKKIAKKNADFFFHVLPLSFSTTRWNFSLFGQYFTIKNHCLDKVVFAIWASAFWQCLQSSHQAVCCHLGPHEEVV
jgi:hypothetical protein